MPTRLRFLFPGIAVLTLLLLACSNSGGGSSGDGSPRGGGGRISVTDGTPPCDHARALVLRGQLRGVPAMLVQALRISVAREVAPSTCDFTGYPGSPGVADALNRALASRAQTDADAALRLIEDRVTAVRANPGSCVPWPSYPCTTELSWLAVQAGRLGPLAGSAARGGSVAAGGSGGGGVVGAAASASADAFPGEAQAAADASTAPSTSAQQPTSSSSGRATAPTTASSAYSQAAANAQANGVPEGPYLDKARAAAESEATQAAASNSKCDGGPKELQAIMEAAARVQILDGSEQVVADVLAAARPVIKSLARQAQAGQDVGMTLPQLYAAADAAGIDVSSNTWMDDPNCKQRWTLRVDHQVRLDIAGEGGGRLIERWQGDITLDLQSNGSGNGTGKVSYRGDMVNPFCRWDGKADDVAASFSGGTPRANRLIGNVSIKSAPGVGAVNCIEGISFSGDASAGSASFVPKVDMPLENGATVRPPMDDPLGLLRQTGYTVTTTYSLRKG